MRTRILPELTNYEAEQFLQRNDLIFIPVGTVELHDSMPLNCEYVVAEALAREMAEQTDGLVLHGPSHMTIGPMIVQFFDEEKVPLLYIDIVQAMFQKIIPILKETDPESAKVFVSDPENLMFGAYGYLGKETDIPLDIGAPDMESKPGISEQWINALNLAPTSAFTG